MAEAVEVIEAQTRLQEASNKQVGYIQGIVLLVILGILFAIIFGTLASSGGDFLLKLKDIEIARGLITFLVVVTAISIALILAVYVLASNEKADQIKERFTFAKDVLAILVGILGTVLGFYYGAKDKNEEVAFSADAQFRGNQMTIHATGATPPYRYTIVFFGEDQKKMTPKVSKDGWLTETIPSTQKRDDPIQAEFIDSKDKKLTKVIKYIPEEKPVPVTSETAPVVPPTPKPTQPIPEKVAPPIAAPVPAPKAS